MMVVSPFPPGPSEKSRIRDSILRYCHTSYHPEVGGGGVVAEPDPTVAVNACGNITPS